jgi:hypothetical protein
MIFFAVEKKLWTLPYKDENNIKLARLGYLNCLLIFFLLCCFCSQTASKDSKSCQEANIYQKKQA